ncbi:FprA family A-type flavoprotein, partial [candidate division WOR-3 bacterium]|nr:FprA family A-type flavoprotein [candidate division WOR-3 bacterium]
EEAKKYYANIVLPFGTQVQKTLEAVSGLKISLIAPSHGVMWKKHIGDIIDNYSKWAKNETIKKSLIVYDSMWGSTKIIAQSIQSSFDALGYITKLIDLKSTHISDIMTDMMDAEYLCVGSPTLNNNMLPTVAAFLTYLKGLAPKNRKAMVFGSYGWGGQSIKQIENVLEEAKFELTYSTKYQYIQIKEYLGKVEEEVKEVLENK